MRNRARALPDLRAPLRELAGASREYACALQEYGGALQEYGGALRDHPPIAAATFSTSGSSTTGAFARVGAMPASARSW